MINTLARLFMKNLLMFLSLFLCSFASVNADDIVLISETPSEKIYVNLSECSKIRNSDGELNYKVSYIVIYTVIQESGAKKYHYFAEYNSSWTKSRICEYFIFDSNNKFLRYDIAYRSDWSYIKDNTMGAIMRDKVRKYF